MALVTPLQILTMVMDPFGEVPSSVTTRPETYIGRDMPGRVLGVVVVGVVVVGVVVVGAGAVPVVPVPVVVPPPLACPNRETQQAVVRRRMRAEFRIRNLRIKAGFIMPRTEVRREGDHVSRRVGCP